MDIILQILAAVVAVFKTANSAKIRWTASYAILAIMLTARLNVQVVLPSTQIV
jgi:hypothetical protein